MLMHDPLFVAGPFSSIFTGNTHGVCRILETICICSSNEIYEISSLYPLILYKQNIKCLHSRPNCAWNILGTDPFYYIYPKATFHALCKKRDMLYFVSPSLPPVARRMIDMSSTLVDGALHFLISLFECN
jgi:hypothetical protein